MRDEPLKKCPKCKKTGLKRLVGGGAGLIFKGTGFYITDYKNKSGGAKEGGSKEGGGEKKSGDAKAGGSESKSTSATPTPAPKPSTDSTKK